jgi:hypothetical protein
MGRCDCWPDRVSLTLRLIDLSCRFPQRPLANLNPNRVVIIEMIYIFHADWEHAVIEAEDRLET